MFKQIPCVITIYTDWGKKAWKESLGEKNKLFRVILNSTSNIFILLLYSAVKKKMTVNMQIMTMKSHSKKV